MKLIDKFLKFLKTDRNTFLTYILTLLSIYVFLDRIVELLILIFTGISVSYWGPLQYTLAIACPVFAFFLSGASSFAKSDDSKYAFVYLYMITLYVIGISMAVQWINEGLWLLFLSVPNYAEIVTTSSDLIRPAFSAIAVYLPLVTFFGLFKFLYTGVFDNKDLMDSIIDYKGLDLSPAPEGTGPYTCEVTICKDKHSGKPVVVPEKKRYESMLVIGPSGSGKTTMVFEPMIARDLEKKYFFLEASKELGYTALKTGIAILNAPYNNDYLNENFRLEMLSPSEGKEKLYQTYLKKMILDSSGSNVTYRNIGITAMSPDYESTSHMIEVAKSFHIPYHLIDPDNPDSIGMNPFILDDPTKTAIAISSVLKGMYDTTRDAPEDSFRENVTRQAIENLTILLKEMYPRLNDEDLPTLEDLLNLLTDFDLVEEMCKKMEYDEELSSEYRVLLSYFKKNFYQTGSGRTETEKYVYAASSQLDNLLRIQGVKNILCNRHNNINFDEALANGEVTFVCTRRGDLGATVHKAFGLFFILSMQYAVLRRAGNEKTRVPHFFYMDEFPDFICDNTTSIFTLYRKYRVGTVISAQNLDQLGNQYTSKHRQTILSNCITQMLFGNATPEDTEWWTRHFGDKRKWKFNNTYDTEKGKYDPKYTNIKYDWSQNFSSDKLRSLTFKNCAYKTEDIKNSKVIGEGKVDFLESKYKQEHRNKMYNFSRFTSGIAEEEPQKNKKKKFNYTNVDFSDKERENEIDPVKTDNSDSSYFFDNEDAIIFDLKKGNPNSGTKK